MKIGRLLTRLVVGGLFVGHGTQKLFGWFEGPGPDGTEEMMHDLDMHPARWHALAAGATETAGGTLLALGLATPLAAASLIGVMITAIRKVHAGNGPWNTSGGYEYNLVLIAALLGLVDGGPGNVSVDRALRIHDTGPAWALAALGLGAAASALAIELGRGPGARRAARAARRNRGRAGTRKGRPGPGAPLSGQASMTANEAGGMVTASPSRATPGQEAVSTPVPGAPSGRRCADGPRLAAIRSRPRCTTSQRPCSS
jgi:putative oxidoreductase